VGRALGFGLNLLLSRSLGPTGLGLFSLVLTTCQTFELTARGGVDYGLSCELTGAAAKRSELEKASVAESALRIVQLSTLVLATALWIWVVPLEGLLPVGLRISRGVAAVALVLIAALESLGGLPWDLLIIAGDTKRVALRQGLFAPLKLLVALAGAASFGVTGALTGYGLASAVQLLWLQRICRPLWSWPKRLWPDWQQAWVLMRSGLALYGTNALAALVFLPLVSEVAKDAGVAEVGYLRVGQIMVQLFTLLPGALTPLLFLRLRATTTDDKQVSFETSLRLIWWLGLAALLAYLLIDQVLIRLFFGEAYLASLQPTRLLVFMAVLDSVNQVLHTPLLASRRTKLFAISQNCGAAAAAGLGWWLIPSMGLQGFLAAKLCFSALPVGIYLLEGWSRFRQTRMVALLLLATIAIAPLCWWPLAESTWALALGGFAAFVLILEGQPLLRHLPGR
jgi:O-antigen/teichoic acid export membrane protein